MSVQRNKRFTLVLSLLLTVALMTVVGMPGIADYWTGVNIKEIGGTAISGSTLPVTCAAGTVSTLEEDAAHSSGAEGFPSWTVRTDTMATSAGTTGDYATLNTDALGRLWVSATYLEDVNETAGGELMVIGTVRRDTASSSAGATTDYATLNTDATGRLWITGTDTEDTAHVSGDEGLATLVVRADTLTSLAGTTGDYTMLLVDANGAQWTHPLSMSTEDAAETAAGSLNMAGSVRRDAAASSAGTTGDNATLNTDAAGKLWISGAFAEDAAHTTSDIGIEVLAVRNDTLAALSGTDGDYSPLQVTAAGALWVSQSGTGVEDAAETAAGDLVMGGTVRRDTAASSAGTTGDNATLNTDAVGGLWVTPTSVGVEDAAETAATNLTMAGSVRRDTAASSAGTTGDNATLNTDAVGKLWVTGSFPEDAAHTTADVGMQSLAVRNDTLATLADTDGDYAPLQVTAAGAVYVSATATGVEDVAETAAGDLVMTGTVRRDTPASSAGTTGDNATLNTDAVGSLYVVQTGAAAIVCGNTDVPGTGTAVQLGANACKEVVVSCPDTNTSPCYVRHSAGNGVTGGMHIAKGESVTLKVNNTNLLFVDAGTNGDDVTWCATN